MGNKFPGDCYRCGKRVEIGNGHFERLGLHWRAQHASCAIEFRGLQERYLQWRAIQSGPKGQRARKVLRDRQTEDQRP